MSGTERVTDRSPLTNRVTDDRTMRDEAGRWLKPCPFCGGEAKEHAAFASRSGVGVYVECGVCGAQSRTFWGDGAQDEAVGAWSRRAERTCRFEPFDEGDGLPRVRCSACGGWLDAVADVEDVALFEFCPMCGARIKEGEA